MNGAAVTIPFKVQVIPNCWPYRLECIANKFSIPGKGTLKDVGAARPDALPKELDKIDLKSLRYFIAVAEAGSFSRAAERLNVAQSHLSRQIMRLEAALGHRLFVRKARHVEITDVGQIFRRETDFIMAKLDSIPERLNEAANGARGSISVGVTVATSFHSLPATVVETVLRTDPLLSFRFCVKPRTVLLESIADRSLQACFAYPPEDCPSEFRIDHLTTEPIVLAVPKQHRLAGRTEVKLSELADETFVLCERIPNPEIYDNIVSICRKVGFSPRVAYHTPDPVSALLLVSAGVAISLVTDSLRTVHAEHLHFIRLSDVLLNTTLALITRADEHLAGVKLLRKHALTVAVQTRTS